MAAALSSGLQKAQDAVRGASSKDKKVVDLARDTDDVNHSKETLRSDHGVAISDTDHWLRVVDQKHTGPSLLEDQLAREKVEEHRWII